MLQCAIKEMLERKENDMNLSKEMQSFNKEMDNVEEKEPTKNFRTENTITVIKTWVGGLNSRVEGEESMNWEQII